MLETNKQILIFKFGEDLSYFPGGGLMIFSDGGVPL